MRRRRLIVGDVENEVRVCERKKEKDKRNVIEMDEVEKM